MSSQFPPSPSMPAIAGGGPPAGVPVTPAFDEEVKLLPSRAGMTVRWTHDGTTLTMIKGSAADFAAFINDPTPMTDGSGRTQGQANKDWLFNQLTDFINRPITA